MLNLLRFAQSGIYSIDFYTVGALLYILFDVVVLGKSRLAIEKNLCETYKESHEDL